MVVGEGGGGLSGSSPHSYLMSLRGIGFEGPKKVLGGMGLVLGV